MLNEIIEAIGYDNILKEMVSMKNSVYVRIPLNRSVNTDEDIIIVDKELKTCDLELSKWFYAREKYSKYIKSNKAIVQAGKSLYPKVITSSIPSSIIFNASTFLKNKNTTNDLKGSLEVLISEYINKFNVNSELLGLYLNNIDVLTQYINNKDFANLTFKIFLDLSIETYKLQYKEYLNQSLFDKKNNKPITYKVNNIICGRTSFFTTLNNNKPLIKNVNSKVCEDIHLLSVDDANKILNLKKYIESHGCNVKIQYGIGDINYTINNDKELVDFVNNPYRIIDDLTKDIYIRNILNSKYIKETTIKTYNDLSKYILNELLDCKVKNSYNDKDKTENKFKTFSLMYYKYIANLNNANFDIFQRVYTNMMRNMLKLYIDDEDINKIQQIINFNICMSDYLFKTNIKGDLIEMINRIKDKILNMDNEYVIENDFEFYILCGQMAKYLKSKTHTDNITNKLFHEYNMAIKTRQLMDILQRDKGRLDYESNNNSRSGKILYAINNYYTLNEKRLKKIDKIRFNMGLYYGENIFYVSNKNNKNKKGE